MRAKEKQRAAAFRGARDEPVDSPFVPAFHADLCGVYLWRQPESFRRWCDRWTFSHYCKLPGRSSNNCFQKCHGKANNTARCVKQLLIEIMIDFTDSLEPRVTPQINMETVMFPVRGICVYSSPAGRVPLETDWEMDSGVWDSQILKKRLINVCHTSKLFNFFISMINGLNIKRVCCLFKVQPTCLYHCTITLLWESKNVLILICKINNIASNK